MIPVSSVLDEQAGVNLFRRAVALVYLNLKRPFLLRRSREQTLEMVDGVPLIVLPGVFNPVVFRSGKVLAQVISGSAAVGACGKALDLGTGSGIAAIFAALRGYRVTAVDLNPDAVRCCRINAAKNHVEDRIQAVEGDLFEPVAGQRFDLVLFNPPFFRGDPRSRSELAWRATGLFERFAAGLAGALAPGGRALILLSTDGDAAGMLTALREHSLTIEAVDRRDFGNEIMTVYCARAPE